MFVVDANVLLYAAEKGFSEHRRCRDLLMDWRRKADAWYTTWGIVYEFCRVATHPRVFRTPWTTRQAWDFVLAILAAPGLGLLVETDRHEDIATTLFKEVPHLVGNVLHDAHTVVLMREHGIRQIYTRDADFHRFANIEVIDPMA